MILDRRFPNDRLPNEPVLAEQMGISRTTVRAALQALERLGVVSRVPGRGTRVRPQVDRSCMLLHRLIGFRGMLESEYDDVRVEQVFRVKPASALAVAALEAESGTEVLVNDKTYYANGEPAVHLLQEVPVDHVPAQVVTDLVDGRMDPPGTLFEFSELWPQREIDNTLVEMVPSVAPRASKDFALKIKPGTPYLELHETHYSETNVPVAFAREMVDNRFVHLRVVRSR
jgi:GntR family transcriptional regulator